MYRYLFGPVPSRRLGRSLGVDLVPLKTCSFDCVFCEVGVTTAHTIERREYVPVSDVIREFDTWLTSGGTADYITFAGSGEPTLHSGIGDVIELMRVRTSTRIALLTNSSLLHLPEVRSAVLGVDLIKASLSVCDNTLLQSVNRPSSGLDVEKIIYGITELRKEFQGELWIEVFLLAGVNDDPVAVGKLAEILRDIGPDKIQLNTVVRPPAEAFAKPVAVEVLETFAKLFEPVAEIMPQVLTPPYVDAVGIRPLKSTG